MKKKKLKTKRVPPKKKKKNDKNDSKKSDYDWTLGIATGWNDEARLTVKLKSSLNHSSKWTYFFLKGLLNHSFLHTSLFVYECVFIMYVCVSFAVPASVAKTMNTDWK